MTRTKQKTMKKKKKIEITKKKRRRMTELHNEQQHGLKKKNEKSPVNRCLFAVVAWRKKGRKTSYEHQSHI